MPYTRFGVCRTFFGGKTALVNLNLWHPLSSKNKERVLAQERLTVRKIREILRLKQAVGLSNRAIALGFFIK
jgi:hypothetical protein